MQSFSTSWRLYSFCEVSIYLHWRYGLLCMIEITKSTINYCAYMYMTCIKDMPHRPAYYISWSGDNLWKIFILMVMWIIYSCIVWQITWPLTACIVSTWDIGIWRSVRPHVRWQTVYFGLFQCSRMKFRKVKKLVSTITCMNVTVYTSSYSDLQK